MPKRTKGATVVQLSLWPSDPQPSAPDLVLPSPGQPAGNGTKEIVPVATAAVVHARATPAPQSELGRPTLRLKQPHIPEAASHAGSFDEARKLATRIIRELDHLVNWTGNRSTYVFQDWLDLVESTLKQQGAIVAALSRGEPLPEDPPDIQAIWKRVRERYGTAKERWEIFTRAYAMLAYESPQWQDVLGLIYMEWGWPNRATGQYFTPWHIARMMAEMTVFHADLLAPRIEQATRASAAARAALAAGAALAGEQAEAWLVAIVLPLVVEQIEPIKINEPCIGSGVMVLAAASVLPEWAVKLGLYQFYGQDTDPLCVQMARINLRMYGLNGYGSGDVARWANQVLQTLPPDLIEVAQRINRENDPAWRALQLMRLIEQPLAAEMELAS